MTHDYVVTVIVNTDSPFSRTYYTHQGLNHAQRRRHATYGVHSHGCLDRNPLVEQLRVIPGLETVYIDPPNATMIFVDRFNSDWDHVDRDVLETLFADLGIPFDPALVRYLEGDAQQLLGMGLTKRVKIRSDGSTMAWPADDSAPETWPPTTCRAPLPV